MSKIQETFCAACAERMAEHYIMEELKGSDPAYRTCAICARRGYFSRYQYDTRIKARRRADESAGE